MTEPPTGPALPDQQQRPPLAPRPPALVVALLLFGTLIYIATLDANSDTYDATYVCYGLIVVIAGVLGVDLAWFRKDE